MIAYFLIPYLILLHSTLLSMDELPLVQSNNQPQELGFIQDYSEVHPPYDIENRPEETIFIVSLIDTPQLAKKVYESLTSTNVSICYSLINPEVNTSPKVNNKDADIVKTISKYRKNDDNDDEQSESIPLTYILDAETKESAAKIEKILIKNNQIKTTRANNKNYYQLFIKARNKEFKVKEKESCSTGCAAGFCSGILFSTIAILVHNNILVPLLS